MIAPQCDHTGSARTLVLTFVATLAGVFFSSVVLADQASETGHPRRLQSVHESDAKPMVPSGAIPSLTVKRTQQSLAGDLWQLISHYETGNLEAAIDGWRQLELPVEHEVWRRLGLGVTLFCLDRLEDANDELMQATQFGPDNALVHYFLGVLHMRQADNCLGQSECNQRRQIELDAVREFELAVKMSESFDHHAPLVPIHYVLPAPYPMSNPIVPPTAGDLADALWADNFEGKAHALLAYLNLDHGRMKKARYHVDKARAFGIVVVLGRPEESEEL